jgi:type VI secretion system protein ImpH
VEQFCGKCFRLEDSALSRLGIEGAHISLGVDAIVGDSIWNQQARFRVQVGPIPFLQFAAFLPDGSAFRALVEWVRFFVGPAMEFELQPILKSADVPDCFLSDEGPEAPRLGWMSWLKTEEFTEDARDAVFSCVKEVAHA